MILFLDSVLSYSQQLCQRINNDYTPIFTRSKSYAASTHLTFTHTFSFIHCGDDGAYSTSHQIQEYTLDTGQCTQTSAAHPG